VEERRHRQREDALPASARGFADNPDRFAFLNGPVVLCAQVDPAKPFRPSSPSVSRSSKALTPAGRPNTFTASADVLRASGGASSVTLEPFYAMHDGRHYQVYFDRFTPTQWQAKEASTPPNWPANGNSRRARWTSSCRTASRASGTRDARRADGGGDFGDRKWRHATDGGWFSWQLKVLPDHAQELWVTYWGSDGGNRIFDLLVDARRSPPSAWRNNRPDRFYDEVYPLPADLLKGKQALP